MQNSPSSFPDLTLPELALFTALNGCSPVEPPAPRPGEVRLEVGSLDPVTQEPAVADCVQKYGPSLNVNGGITSTRAFTYRPDTKAELDACLSQAWGSALSDCDTSQWSSGWNFRMGHYNAGEITCEQGAQ